MIEKVSKYENPVRIAELSPVETLSELGFGGNKNLCDIGSGSGVFTFPASKLTSGTVYALDISHEMLALIKDRCEEQGIDNVVAGKVVSDVLPVPSGSCDIALMVTSFHEVENKAQILSEIKRILKSDGKLVIIEFHKRETPIGPPVPHRISAEEVESTCVDNGFKIVEKSILGDNFYAYVFAE